MLRIIQNTQASSAKSYYSTADYYSEGQELTGQWRGQAARLLGLTGEVQPADWDALCDNRHPQLGDPLTIRQRSNRTVGYDFNFHVPKSVSVLYGLSKDERILDAFQQSVDATMRDIESEMQTRVRKRGQNEDRHSGNLAWGEFIHLTSRPVDGIPDPHLHAHCFVFNATWDNEEKAWKAGQFRDLKRDAPYFEALFHSRLSKTLADLGLPIERTSKGWEITGIPKETIARFSRRTAQIEELALEKGIEDPEAKAELGAKTRLHKIKELKFSELQAEWRNQLSGEELDAIAAVQKRLGTESRPSDDGAVEQAIKYAIAHEFERNAVVPERKLLATALKRAVGQTAPEQVLREMDQQGLILGHLKGRRMATTRTVLDEESRVIHFARRGRGTCAPMAPKGRQLKRDWLNMSQQRAVRHILESRDRVTLVRGAAGVGKTSLMQEAAEGIEAGGKQVIALAPSADASRGVLRSEGFENADTVARFLCDESFQRQARGQVLWIDEAGLLGTRTLSEVFDLAERLDARVVLSGDPRQHGSVERGATLRLLEEEAGLRAAEVKEIQRQRGAYKAAVRALAEGDVTEGFQRLDDLGWIKEIPTADRYRQMAADYVETVMAGQEALVVSPTHFEGARITAEIRRRLREEGRLGADERTFTILENASLTEAERGDQVNYAPSDVLVFHQNAQGFTRGGRLAVGDRPEELPLDQAKRFQVFHTANLKLAPGDQIRITRNGYTADGHALNNGALYGVARFDQHGNIMLENGWTIDRNWGFFEHGYVVTSHASQGKTIQGTVFVGQSSDSFPASSREQFYVSASRAKKKVVVYTDDKEALLEAVSHSDERVTATELFNSEPSREIVHMQRRYAEQTATRAASTLRQASLPTELVHDRV